MAIGDGAAGAAPAPPTYCTFHLTLDRYHYGICTYAHAHDWYANHMQNSWY